MTADADISAWAASKGIAVGWPDAYPRDPNDFRDNPCIDFGRVVTAEPRFVLRPLGVDQLADCVAMLGERGIPFCVRGAGHSSGGQSLSDGGAVIDTRRLNRILDDRPHAEQIVAEGGTPWLAVIERLQVQGRRPIALTGNPRVTIGGTLSTGGFGDTTHLEGLVIRSVDALTLIAPDGSRRQLRRGGELFRHVLAGRGQLGVIAEATLRTVRKPLRVALRRVNWASLADFARDSSIIAAERLYEYVRARVVWGAGDVRVEAAVGNFSDTLTADPAIDRIAPDRVAEPELRDLLADLRRGPRGSEWRLPTPAMEIALPLPAALELWARIRDRVVSGGLVRYLRRGTSVMVTPPEPELPLAPVTAGPTLLVALRPEVPAGELDSALPVLREIGEAALNGGGRIYMISIELETPGFVERQFGAGVAGRFRALKASLDPEGLCNPGLL